MRSIRSLIPRLLPVLLLGGAMLAVAPVQQASAQEFKPMTLTTDLLDKLEKFTKAVKEDPAAKAEMDAMDKDESVAMAATTGSGLGTIVNSKYPKVAAAFKSAGLAPDDYARSMMSLMMAAMTAESNGPADANTPQANIDFAKANKDRIAALSDMK